MGLKRKKKSPQYIQDYGDAVFKRGCNRFFYICSALPASTVKRGLSSIEPVKLKIFGWGYVKDFCISLFQKEQEDKAVKIYYAECLRIITENTAKMGGGSYITAKLSDIINPKPVEKRTGEEIAADIIKRAGIEVI